MPDSTVQSSHRAVAACVAHGRRSPRARPRSAGAAIGAFVGLSVACGLLGLAVAPSVAAAQDSTPARSGPTQDKDDAALQLGRKLTEARAELEALNARLNSRRKALDARTEANERQKADVESQVRREETRLKLAEQALARVRQQETERTAEGRALVPALKAAVAQVRASIKAGLPFRQTDRLAELDQLEAQLDAGTLRPGQALTRLWSLIQDEQRLGGESGLYRQPVTIDGQQMLADTLRVGMVMLFLRLPDGRFGYARREGTDWRYLVETDPAQQTLLRAVFDSFAKRVRSGFFTLPNALPQAGGGAKP